MSGLGGIVRLKCFKDGNRLRVRIVSPGYNPDANCQFPRAIRKEGCEYTVPTEAISFSEGPNLKFFYRIKKKLITIVEEEVKIEKVFGDEEIDMDCVVCMNNEKDVVFAPCGHYCCCSECATFIHHGSKPDCPMCRTKISQVVKRDQIA